MIKNLILIDGHSLAYRMFFALERTGMKTSSHFPTWAVYGFFKALFDLLKKQTELDGMAVAFDMGRVTFRTELYPEYKAHRKTMPDSLSEQLGKIREGVELLGIPIFEVPNYEADDLIGTLAKQAVNKGVNVTILTGDQDAFQIIDNESRIAVLLPSSKDGLVQYDRQKVREKLGVFPEQITDFKGLKGDSSDNIPGVPGVGDKTATKLLDTYNTLENVLEHVDEIPGNKVRQSLHEYKEQALLSKDLATIRYDAPVTFSEESCHLRLPDIDDFLKFLAEMEFRSLLTQSSTLLKPFIAHVMEEGYSSKPEKPFAEEGQQQLLLINSEDTVAAKTEKSSKITAVTAFPTKEEIESLLPYYQVPFKIVKTRLELEDFLKHVHKTGIFAIDIETTGLDFLQDSLVGIALSWNSALTSINKEPKNFLNLKDYPDRITVLKVDEDKLSQIKTIYIPVNHKDCHGSLSTDEILAFIKPLLEDCRLIKVAHNAKFEWNMFRKYGVKTQGLVFDTMVASYVINSERRHGLKALAHDVLGHTMRDITELIGKGKNQISFDEVPFETAASYASCDSHVALELAQRFIAQLDSDQESLLYEIELPLIEVLSEMEFNGISLDIDYLNTLGKDLEKQIKSLEQEIYVMAGVTFNLNSPKQVGEVLFERLKIPARGWTPTKASYTTNAKVIESLAPDYPIVQKLLDYRQLFKLKSTYIDALPVMIRPHDHRLHTSFNQTITSTGRLSSSDPNLQNIPIRTEIGRSLRQAFVPADRTHFSILSADYSQIELRLLAHFSEDPKLVESFCSGEDIHQATAALIFDLPLDKVTKEMRYRAKAVNFGIIYGQTAFGLSSTLKITPKEASEFIDTYFSRYPKVKTYIEQVKAEVRHTGRVKTICGRSRDFTEGLSHSAKNVREFSERAAFNMPLQGSAADIMKIAMIRLYQRLKHEKMKTKMILQVHDEIVLELCHTESKKIRELIEWAMCLDEPLKVPLVVDISEGPSWMEME